MIFAAIESGEWQFLITTAVAIIGAHIASTATIMLRLGDISGKMETDREKVASMKTKLLVLDEEISRHDNRLVHLEAIIRPAAGR